MHQDSSNPKAGLFAIHVLGIFSLFKREKAATSAPTVRLDMPPTAVPARPPQAPEAPITGLRADLRFKGLHQDVDPTPNVRPAQMTCPHCERTFRYFTNSNGLMTSVRCPGCAQQYRV